MRLKRGRKARQNAPADGGEHCDKCGQIVRIEADGRCRLGHRVGTPLSALSEPFGGSGDAFDTTTDGFGTASEAFPGYEPAFGESDAFAHGDHDLDPYEPDADPLTATELFAAATQGSALDGFSPAAPPASHDAVSPPPRETSEGRPANTDLEHPYDQVLSWEEIPGTELTAPAGAENGWPVEDAPAAFAFSPVSALDVEPDGPVTERFVFDPLGEDPAR
jgi:hypothetical protein